MEAEIKTILTSKQQETYKQIKPIITAVGRNDKDAIKAAITAIRALLAGADHKVQTKLNALRVLEVDCYQTASRPFIKATEQYLLNHLKTIAEDSLNEERFEVYADREYVEKEDLVKFKSYLISMFTLCVECIKNWAEWQRAVQPSAVNPFAELRKDLEQKGVRFPLADQYFKQTSKPQFLKNHQTLNKNDSGNEGSGIRQWSAVQSLPAEKPPVQKAPKDNPTTPQQSKIEQKKGKVSPYSERILAIMKKMREISDQPNTTGMKEEADRLGIQLEQAFDIYAGKETDFDEEFIGAMYDQYDQLREKVVQRAAQALQRQRPAPKKVEIVEEQRFPEKTLLEESISQSGAKSEENKFREHPLYSSHQKYETSPVGPIGWKVPNDAELRQLEKSQENLRARTDYIPKKKIQTQEQPKSQPAHKPHPEIESSSGSQMSKEPSPIIQSPLSTGHKPISQKVPPLELPPPHIRVLEPVPLSSDRKSSNEPQVSSNSVYNRDTFGKAQSSIMKSSENQSKVDPEIQRKLLQEIQVLTQQRNSKVMIAEKIRQRLESSNVEKIRQELSGQAADIQRLSQQVHLLQEQLSRHQQLREQQFIQPTTNRIVEERPITFFKSKDQVKLVCTPISNMDELTIQLPDRQLTLFKLAVLGKGSKLAPESPFNIQLAGCQLLSRPNKQQYCHLQLSSDIGENSLQIDNSQGYSVWKKPSYCSPADSRNFHEVAITLEAVPFPYIRCLMLGNGSEPARKFYLPVTFLNFLKPGNVELRDFQKVFITNESKVVHSKILKLVLHLLIQNEHLAGDADELRGLLAMDYARIRSQQCLCGAYLYEPLDVLLLVAIEILNNQRTVIRVLQLNKTGGSCYAKELLRTFTFLLAK